MLLVIRHTCSTRCIQVKTAVIVEKFKMSMKVRQKGDLSDFWDFPAQPSLRFTGNDHEKEEISNEQQFSG